MQSASGNTKQARDSRFQAVYALKGKIINAEKSEMGKILENQEVKDLINIIGTGIQEEFDINKLKFGKIIIGCDADVD